jgi:hypothetical protein
MHPEPKPLLFYFRSHVPHVVHICRKCAANNPTAWISAKKGGARARKPRYTVWARWPVFHATVYLSYVGAVDVEMGVILSFARAATISPSALSV